MRMSEPDVVVISGAGSGIGRAAALLLVNHGNRVAILDRDGRAAANVATECGPRAIAIEADVRLEDSMAAAAAEVQAKFGAAVRAVVCCAGVSTRGSIGDSSADSWVQEYEINTMGVMRTCKAFLPGLLADSGDGTARSDRSIVLISSILAIRGAAGVGSYCTSKAALHGMALSLAQELGPQGIRTNVVAPGPIVTPLFMEVTTESDSRDLAETVPMRRLGRPEDVAELIAFLTGAASSFVNGQLIAIDGGLSTNAYWR
jgi:NAD(P)-dependent dehydrogenase (short-subunit alcohol dehydrogenase family)